MSRVAGFTAMEMMIALSLAIIITLFAIPSFRQLSHQTTDKLAQTKLLQQLRLAQQLAAVRMMKVVVCLSEDGNHCAASVGNMLLTFASSQLVSSVRVANEGVLHLRSFPYYRNYLSIIPLADGRSDNGTFWYCSNNKTQQWAIAVGQVGEPHRVKVGEGEKC